MTRPIEIADSKEFAKLMRGLSRDIVNANIHFTLFRNLNDSINEYCTELNQSPAFWNLTLTSHLDAAWLRLCRAYDTQRSALSLATWLATIRANLEIFESSEFRVRQKDNAFVESLSKVNRMPDERQLVDDMTLVSKTDGDVRRLLRWRNNVIAHRSPKETIAPVSAAGDPLQIDEFQLLLDRAVKMLNRYSDLFEATTYLVSMVGADDYTYVLDCIRGDIQRSDAGLKEELKNYER